MRLDNVMVVVVFGISLAGCASDPSPTNKNVGGTQNRISVGGTQSTSSGKPIVSAPAPAPNKP